MTRVDACARAANVAASAGKQDGDGATDGGDRRGMDALRADAFLDLLLGTGVLDPGDLDPGDEAAAADGADPPDDTAAYAGTTPVSQAAAASAPAGLPRPLSPSFRVGITVPLATLLRLSEEPGQLDGYGPVVADIARQVTAQATRSSDRWCYALTDQAGQVIHRGRTRYRPTTALREFLAARDVTCRAPGCRQPAARCDLHHVVPHREGGPTHACNCGMFCRHHHRMHHEGGWQLTQPLPGIFVWTSPTGHTYVRDPSDEREPPDLAPPPSAKPPPEP